MNNHDEKLRIEGILIAADSIIETFKQIPPDEFDKEMAIGVVKVMVYHFKQKIGE